jgi:hypothetical protein
VLVVFRQERSSYIPHAQKVVEHMAERGQLLEFQARWRRHFIHTMQPKFLPAFWTIDYVPENWHDDDDDDAADDKVKDEDDADDKDDEDDAEWESAKKFSRDLLSKNSDMGMWSLQGDREGDRMANGVGGSEVEGFPDDGGDRGHWVDEDDDDVEFKDVSSDEDADDEEEEEEEEEESND